MEGYTGVFIGTGRDGLGHCVGGTLATFADIFSILLELVCDSVSAARLAGQGQLARGQQHWVISAGIQGGGLW